ncbi:MAG: DUF1476 domain-containing protein [Hyphomicrobium sp.]
MTTFDDREKGYEKKFAHDSELRFRAEALRNKTLAEWAGSKMGLSGFELENYIKDVRKADLKEKGDDDVFSKVKADLVSKGIQIQDTEIRKIMNEALARAMIDLQKP